MGLVEEAEHTTDVAGVNLARGGEPEPAAVLAHKSQPEVLLQRRKAGRRSRLGDDKALGGRSDRPGLRHRQEGTELCQGHSSSAVAAPGIWMPA